MKVLIEDDEVVLLLDLLSNVKDVRAMAFIARLREVSQDSAVTKAYQHEAEVLSKEGELEVDEGAVVSISEDPEEAVKGAYVMAWLWVQSPFSVEHQKVASGF